MLALKLTAPGVPDIYQGDELPLPRAGRSRQPAAGRLGLAPGDAGAAAGRLARRIAETAKLWLTTRLLPLRIRRARRVLDGRLRARSTAGEHAVAFVRGGEVLVVVATRAAVPDAASLRGAEGSWRDVLGGGTRKLSAEEPLNRLLGTHGVAVLEL